MNLQQAIGAFEDAHAIWQRALKRVERCSVRCAHHLEAVVDEFDRARLDGSVELRDARAAIAELRAAREEEHQRWQTAKVARDVYMRMRDAQVSVEVEP